jgi:phenylalanine-4-hydroxylase
MTDKGYVPVYTTTIVKQPWETYTETDHQVWATLFRRQRELLPGRASAEFLRTQDVMGMGEHAIPKFSELNVQLKAKTGWEIIAVEGLLPELAFFEHLANRQFPVTWWIRKPEQMDYLAEPDLFHDLFGHVPLLMDPMFADYMQAYGKGGVKAHGLGSEALSQLTRLYWYTVEFGLINTPEGLRIYGAGILSSKGESIHCLESVAPNRIGFDLLRVMSTRYRIDTFQKMFDATLPDFTPYYQKLAGQESIPAGQTRNSDQVINCGTGEGWLQEGDV